MNKKEYPIPKNKILKSFFKLCAYENNLKDRC